MPKSKNILHHKLSRYFSVNFSAALPDSCDYCLQSFWGVSNKQYQSRNRDVLNSYVICLMTAAKEVIKLWTTYLPCLATEVPIQIVIINSELLSGWLCILYLIFDSQLLLSFKRNNICREYLSHWPFQRAIPIILLQQFTIFGWARDWLKCNLPLIPKKSLLNSIWLHLFIQQIALSRIFIVFVSNSKHHNNQINTSIIITLCTYFLTCLFLSLFPWFCHHLM